MGYLAARLSADQPTLQQREQLIAEITRAILDRVGFAEAIFIFGSVLDDSFTHASDIDVAVVFSNSTDLASARKLLFTAPPLVTVPYDLLLYERVAFDKKAAEGGICQLIKKTARLVYDKRSKV